VEFVEVLSFEQNKAARMLCLFDLNTQLECISVWCNLFNSWFCRRLWPASI